MLKKETLAQMFSCEFCDISKNTFLYRTPLVAASAFWNVRRSLFFIDNMDSAVILTTLSESFFTINTFYLPKINKK